MLVQVDDPVFRSASFSVLHLVCIGTLFFFIWHTYKRHAEKLTRGEVKPGPGSLPMILLQFEITILAGFVLQHLSSDILLYIRYSTSVNPMFSDPAATSVMEHLNMLFQVVMAVFIAYLAWFANRLFFFKGHGFNVLVMAVTAGIIAVIVAGIFAGFAWAPYDEMTGKRNPATWVLLVNGAYLVATIIPALAFSTRLARKATTAVEKGGFIFITVFFALMVVVAVFQGLFTVTKDYFFSYGSWALIPASIMFAYLGLIMPPRARAWFETRA